MGTKFKEGDLVKLKAGYSPERVMELLRSAGLYTCAEKARYLRDYPEFRVCRKGGGPSGVFTAYPPPWGTVWAYPEEAFELAITDESPSLTPPALLPPPAVTHDEGKEPLAWLPWAAINEMSRVQQFGAKKYGDFNNYRRGLEVSRNLSCALRHIRDFMTGHDKDDESGLSPLAHAMCRLAFVFQNLADGSAIDDRFKL